MLKRESLLAGCAAALAAMLTSPAVAQTYNWTGLYLGGNLGGAFGHFDTSTSANPAFFAPAGPDAVAYLNRDGSPSASPKSLIGGVQAGYNWQSNGFVFGLETDIQALSLSTSRNTGILPAPPLSPFLAHGFSDSSRSTWLWTLRPRVGVTFGNALAYVTGGLAIGNHTFSQNYFIPFLSDTGGGSANSTRTGWTAGAGLEYALGGHWSVKGEYLHVDLGSVSFDSVFANHPGALFHATDRLTSDIGRVGINYKF